MKTIDEIRARAGEMLAVLSDQKQVGRDADPVILVAHRKRCLERALREAGHSKSMARRLTARLSGNSRSRN